MKNTSRHRSYLSPSKRIAPFAFVLMILLAVAAWPIVRSSATTLTNALISALKVPAVRSAIPVQGQTSTYYLHGTGPVANPPTLFLNTTAPTATSEKYKDSTSITRNGGNSWKEVGTWTAASASTPPTLAALSDFHAWLGLKNSDDQGTYFDLRVEAYMNSALLASGQSLCITGVTRNPASAKEVVVSFAAFSAATFNGTSDELKLKVLTRVGTNADGSSCGGHSNAVGLRLYFDAVSRASRFNAQQGGSSDTTPPVLSVAQPADNSITSATQINVTGTFTDQSQTTITVNGVAATIQGNNFSANVPLSEGPNSLLIAATDAAGNTAQVTRQVVRDTAAPTVAIEQPTADTLTKNSPVTVTGTFSDATTTIIKVSNVEATLAGNTFTAAVPLVEGGNVLQVTATDGAGNITLVNRSITLDTIAPVLTMQSPADGTLTAAAEIIVSGTLSDAHEVSLTVNSVPATITQNSYTATVPLSVGHLLLIATAVDAAGNETAVEHKITRAAALTLNVQEPLEGQLADSGEIRVAGMVTGTDVHVSVNGQPVSMVGGIVFGGYATLTEGTHTVTITATDVLGRSEQIVRSVVVDTTPPTITEVLPASNQLVFETTTTISGRVSDATAVTVKVNDVDATIGAGGVFTLANLAVSEGENAVRVEAIDALGHNTLADSVFLGKDRTAPTTVLLFPVPAETRLQSQQVEGRAEPGTIVNITGGLQPATAEAADGTGLFFATVNLAIGNNTLTVTNVDKDGNVSAPVSLTVRSDPSLTRPLGQAIQIHISVNDAQKGLIGQELPRPLIARLTDVAGNEVAGVAVTFSAVEGGGSFVGGNHQFVSITDAQGHASARYIGGATPGFQYIRADFPNNLSKPVSFSAELLSATPGAQTTASGVVMDQNLRALPNVLVRLGGQQTRTGIDGRFLMQNVASGPHQVLELIGRDQIQFPGRWPNISYDFDVLAGVDNNLGRPLFLPRVNAGVAMPLDANNIITSDTVYELPAVGGLPPIRVTAKMGTHVSFPPDVTDKRLSVTRIPVNRTPMTLEEGRAASLYISVQPSGAIFEPALEISFPNLDHLPANSEVLLMSFDHDAGRYVQMGTGHVSADASLVKSASGSGIRVGAWHAFSPDPPQKESTILSYVQVEGNPAFEGKDVQVTNGTIMGVRVVEYSHASNASGQLSRILLRALVVQPGDAPPVVEAEFVQTKAAKPTVTVAPQRVFIGMEKSIEVTATLTSTPNGNPEFKWSSSNKDIADVEFAPDNTKTSSPNKVKITGGKKPGTTKIKVEYKSSNGGKAQAEVEVNVVKVEFQEISPCAGFDDTKVNDEPFWLTVVLNGTFLAPQPGGTAQARVKITPASAATEVGFESVDQTRATVAPAVGTTSPQQITVTGLTHGETFVRAMVNHEEIGKLGIAVRRRVITRVSFHFMSDTGGHRQHRANTNDMPGATNVAATMVAGMNNILTRQTGIEYVVGNIFFQQVQQDLGPVVSEDIDWPFVTAFADTDPNTNQDIYFVWELEKTDTIPVPQPGQTVNRVIAAFLARGGNNIVAEEGADAQDLSHEALHSAFVSPTNPFPGEPSHSNVQRELLYPTRNGTGCLIPKRDMDAFHNSIP